MSKTETYLNSANALVCVIGTVTADALVPGAGTALSGGASLNYLRKRLFGQTPEINQHLASQLQAALTKPKTPLPREAAILIPQMIERATLTPADIMGHQLNATTICDAMLRKMRDPEHKRPEIQIAFRSTVTPVLECLLNDPAMQSTLQPAFQKAVAESLNYIGEQVQLLTGQLKDTAEELGLTKGLILGLARRIAVDVEDIHAAHGELNRAIDIAQRLERDAALPSNTSDQIDLILDRVNELNAEDKFDEAASEIDKALAGIGDEQQHLTARHQRILDIALDQDILRRDAESAANRVVQRAKLDHADQPSLFNALRKIQDDWYARGLRYGLPFDLTVSIVIARRVLDLGVGNQQKGTALNDLAIALQQQGKRTGGPTGADLLGQAVAACREALSVYTRADHPVQWAMTQENMAINELAIAIHDATPDPAPHLTAALEHVDAALTVFDPEHMPYNHTKATALRDKITAALAAR